MQPRGMNIALELTFRPKSLRRQAALRWVIAQMAACFQVHAAAGRGAHSLLGGAIAMWWRQMS